MDRGTYGLQLLKAGAIVVMLLALSAARVDADSAQPAAPQASANFAEKILPDPAIRRGVLPNGMRYVIMTNATPKGAVSLRLGVDAGTFEEGEGEHGVAHFVEHMAFNFGQNGHEEGPERAFAAEGVSFGRDQNAETEIFRTVYRLDLPRGDEASLDLAFRWLRGVARDSHFQDAAVARERGIILAERDVRATPDLSVYEASQQFLAPGLRAARGDTIGTRKEISAIDAAAVQAFYDRWYRPDNVVFVVVGDAPADVIARRIEAAFADWTATGPMPAKPALGTVDESRGLAVQTLAEPQLPTQIAICRAQSPPPPHDLDIARLRRETLSAIWTRILNTRLAQLAKSAAPPFLSAEAGANEEAREYAQICVAVSPIEEHWQAALRAVNAELRRAATTAPDAGELDAAIGYLVATYRGDVSGASTRNSQDLATTILDKEMRHEIVPSPVEAFRDFLVAADGISGADVKNAFNRDWSGAGPLITLVAPNPPAAAEISKAWADDALLALDAAPHRAAAPAPWSYVDFGPDGRVVKRDALQAPDFVRLRFANGVVLNFKHTDFDQGQVKVRVRFGAGRSEIPNRDYVAASLGAGFFKQGGVGRFDYQDIAQLFDGWSWDAALQIGDNAFDLKGDTTSGGLRNQMQILAAYVTDPGFRSDLDARIPSAIESFYRQYRASPELLLTSALPSAIAPDGPFTVPPEADLMRLRMKDYEALFKPALSNGALEITIVGDTDEATATELVAETFGALPPRNAASRARADTYFLRFPDHRIPTVHVTHQGPQNQAMYVMTWPLFVATPERRREQVALMLLARVFDDTLRHRIRQELGKTYAPDVTLYGADRGDQSYIQAEVAASPDDIDDLRAETRRVADRLADGDFSDADIEAVRKPLLAELAAAERTNDWWLDGLAGSSSSDDGLDAMRNDRRLAQDIGASEVRKAAAAWLARAPFVGVAMPAAAQIASSAH